MSCITGGQGGSRAATRDRIFQTRETIVRLVSTVLAEGTDKWAGGRRNLGLNVLARCRLSTVADNGSDGAAAAGDSAQGSTSALRRPGQGTNEIAVTLQWTLRAS